MPSTVSIKIVNLIQILKTINKYHLGLKKAKSSPIVLSTTTKFSQNHVKRNAISVKPMKCINAFAYLHIGSHPIKLQSLRTT